MKVGIIGRSELMMNTLKKVLNEGYEVSFIITAKGVPEYVYQSEDFQAFSEENNIPFLHSAKLESAESLAFLKNFGSDTDICLSVNYSGIIGEKVTSLFRLGILNAHLGDLPKYRGNATGAWAILNGERKVVLCIHKMIGGELDSGDIILKDYILNDGSLRIGHIYDWMSKVIPELYLQSLNLLTLDSEFFMEKQSKTISDSLRCFPRKPEDGLIDFNRSSDYIVKLVNASSEPFLGAFCYFDGNKAVIWRAAALSGRGLCYVSGQVLSINFDDGSVDIGCGNGSILRVTDMEYGGVRNQPATWVKSIRSRFKSLEGC